MGWRYLGIWRNAGLNFFVIKNIEYINGMDFLVDILQIEKKRGAWKAFTVCVGLKADDKKYP